MWKAWIPVPITLKGVEPIELPPVFLERWAVNATLEARQNGSHPVEGGLLDNQEKKIYRARRTPRKRKLKSVPQWLSHWHRFLPLLPNLSKDYLMQNSQTVPTAEKWAQESFPHTFVWKGSLHWMKNSCSILHWHGKNRITFHNWVS